jgi:hypothetical protein
VIKALEDELGQPLFERRGRGIVPTEFGRYFAARATAILDHVESVIIDSKPDLERTLAEAPDQRFKIDDWLKISASGSCCNTALTVSQTVPPSTRPPRIVGAIN